MNEGIIELISQRKLFSTKKLAKAMKTTANSPHLLVSERLISLREEMNVQGDNSDEYYI